MRTTKTTLGTRSHHFSVRATLGLGALLLALALSTPASALAAPVLQLDVDHNPPEVASGTYAKYTLIVTNIGDEATEEGNNPVLEFSVPPGMEITSVTDELKDLFGFVSAWECTVAGDSQSVSCSGPGFFGGSLPIGPDQEACAEGLQPFLEHCRITVMARVDPSTPPGILNAEAEVCGGAAACATATEPTDVIPKQFRIKRFDGAYLQENGDPATEAGSHPDTVSDDFSFKTRLTATGVEKPIGELKDASSALPPGLVGNPQAYPTCSEEQLIAPQRNSADCPPGSQIGTVLVSTDTGTYFLGVFNMQAAKGTPAVFGFNILNVATHIFANLRTGEDYGITLTAKNTPRLIAIKALDFEFWGVPAAPSHDSVRCPAIPEGFEGCPSPVPPSPFISMPTSCGDAIETRLEAISWTGEADSAGFLSHDNTLPTPNPIGITGCNAVDFSPTLQARPTTNLADSPSGLDVDLHIPLHEACDPGPPTSCEAAEAQLKDATVTLPEGLVVNPSGANGLDGCSLAEFGYTGTDPDGTIHTTPGPATCPDASKQGTVTVETPLLEKPLKGSIYLADPHQNPFGSLLAIYLAVDDPQTGIVLKLAGEVKTDPNTGRITTTFRQNPQQPFEHFRLHFFGGAGGALRTPAVCGTYSTTSLLTPWTAPEGQPASPSDAWAIEQAPGGGSCPKSPGALPNAPGLDAGAVSPIAAAHTPTVVSLRRADGTQELSAVKLTLPPGLTGKLAGVGSCSDAALAQAASKSGNEEKASPSCPSSSRIGSVDVAAGAGPAPYNTQGTAYLTGPYKGAPLSVAIITPATAGPFDLGTVVVRVALFVDPTTAQITAISDPIPSILQGIPLDVRSAALKLDRPDFSRNGTSCDPSAFTGELTSTLGQVVPLSERFQLGECIGLPFKPKLAIRLFGGTKRGAHPALRGTLTMPPGGANLASASVALPHSEFLDQSHIGTVCTRVQFAADQCPAASLYGKATATSPLVDYALQGPVYLRSSSNKLPDVVVALHGPPSQPIEVEAAARIDSVKGGIRASFEGTPDLPVTSVVLEMAGGKKGLFQNSTNICRAPHKATAELEGHNGKTLELTPVLRNGKCAKAKQAAKGKAANRQAGVAPPARRG
jgi:hypothetical protein